MLDLGAQHNQMNVLLLVQKNQRAILDRLYEAIEASCNCDTRWLSDLEQTDLERYFDERVNLQAYDRIVMFLRFKKEIKQARFIRKIPNLVILEHDACQNYMDSSKYQGKFSSHYRQIPWARIIVSGYQLSRKLAVEGFDAVFVPKGYDHTLLWDTNHVRDIDLGFIGSLNNKIYLKRTEFIRSLGKLEQVTLLQTKSGEDYRHALNRIRFFLVPDLGANEYMLKTFEAMACGCLVIAADQGEEENQALGFEHMRNIILYQKIEDIPKTLAFLRRDHEAFKKIRLAGRDHALAKFTFAKIGGLIVNALEPRLRDRREFLHPSPLAVLLDLVKRILGGENHQKIR